MWLSSLESAQLTIGSQEILAGQELTISLRPLPTATAVHTLRRIIFPRKRLASKSA